MDIKKKSERCRYCHRFMGKNHDENHCVVEGWENDKVKTVTDEECEDCEQFDSRYIEYPIEVSAIDNQFNRNKDLHLKKCGTPVKITPCADEYKNKTYFGILLGDLPLDVTISRDRETNELTIGSLRNPAILVPELNKIIFGCESYWGKIGSIEELKDITTEDIENVWYVKLLKDIMASQK